MLLHPGVECEPVEGQEAATTPLCRHCYEPLVRVVANNEWQPATMWRYMALEQEVAATATMTGEQVLGILTMWGPTHATVLVREGWRRSVEYDVDPSLDAITVLGM